MEKNSSVPEAIKAKIRQLQKENAAYRVQGLLLDRFVAMLRSPSHEAQMLKTCLRETLELATELTAAERGSIFLFDDNGAVSDSILTRRSCGEEQSKLIGIILENGLAGWVCRHRVCGVVHDADNDSRWLPLKDQPYAVGSAMAVPIVRGQKLFGILTLLHSRKHHFNDNLTEAMQATSDQIALVLENVKLYVELSAAKATAENYADALNRELARGRKIQKDFLPSHLPQLPDLEIAAEFIPAMQVSGDFYDVFGLPGELTGIVIGDVSDKGVGAALYMALVRSLIRMFAAQCCRKTIQQSNAGSATRDLVGELQASALSALDITNDYMSGEHNAEGMFATAFFGVIHPASGMMRYVNAGHLPVYHIGGSGALRRLSATAPAVGFQGGLQFQYSEHHIDCGSILFGYTDGVTEALSPEGEMYGKQRLEDLIRQLSGESAGAALGRVLTDLHRFAGSAVQSDDITMLAVRRKQPR